MRARLREFSRSSKNRIYIPGNDRRKILAALHPDGVPDPTMKKRHEEAFQIFSTLPIREIPRHELAERKP